MSNTPRTDATEDYLKDRPYPDTIIHLARELERENAALRNEVARLNNQTNWVCSCGGTDCAGRKENAALREDKERLDWIIGEAHYLFFKELASDLAKGRQQIDAARKEAQP